MIYLLLASIIKALYYNSRKSPLMCVHKNGWFREHFFVIRSFLYEVANISFQSFNE
ncbi:hypothetical protein SAMN04487770_1567 [Butyrivibrio sp. ob235]|nr:hypothetical protein SAMN04487770_1567 [Butyrivibrio sp. ob235]